MASWLMRSVLLVVFALGACQSEGTGSSTDAHRKGKGSATLIGYDLRRVRPASDPLPAAFDRLREQARADGKQVAVLFSADWCEQCRELDLSLGEVHPEQAIGHIRILQLKEEDWERAGRIGEFNDLRVRWDPVINTYPMFMLLDDRGNKVEEMRDAIGRLESQGMEASVEYWFESVRKS